MILTALFLAAAAPDASAAAKPATAAPAAVQANALALSRLLNPEEKMVSVVVRALEAGFQSGLQSGSEEAKVFAQHPGLADAVLSAARPVISAHVRRSSPKTQARYAGFFAERFTAAELDSLLGFYSSPTGTKMIEGMYSGVDLSAFVEKFEKNPDAKLASGDVSAISRSTMQRIFPVFDDKDKDALIAFTAKPVYPKLVRALPDFQRFVADIANEPDPALDALMEATVEKAVQDFFAREAQAASAG